MTSKLSEALLRVEKKLDILLERTKPQPKAGENMLFEAPLHQHMQTCPLCCQIVQFVLSTEGVHRSCGCHPPI